MSKQSECKYCNNVAEDGEESNMSDIYGHAMRINLNGEYPYIDVWSDGPYGDQSKRINYCPMCGRKLGDEVNAD
jgi:hypothetical protein